MKRAVCFDVRGPLAAPHHAHSEPRAPHGVQDAVEQECSALSAYGFVIFEGMWMLHVSSLYIDENVGGADANFDGADAIDPGHPTNEKVGVGLCRGGRGRGFSHV